MKKNKILTFIIVTWNNDDTIIECLDSIYKHCEKFNIIIIDNNSSDQTVKMIEHKDYKDCLIISSKENNGFALANNIGLDKVKTEYVCFLNPDTILLEDIIYPSINILHSRKDIGIVGSKLLYPDLSLQASTFNFCTPMQVYLENMKIGQIFPNFIKEKKFPHLSKSKHSKIVDWVIGAEMIMLTSDAKAINGFSLDYYMYTEDMDICKKMLVFKNKKTYYLADNKLIHIGGVSEAKNVNYNKLKKIIDNKIIFVKKYYSPKTAYFTAKILIHTYLVRFLIVKLFYFGNNRKQLLEKMKTGYFFSKESYKELIK